MRFATILENSSRAAVRHRLAGWVAAAFLLNAGPACSSVGLVRVDGSSTVFPLMERVVTAYREERVAPKVSVGISGSLGGFRKLLHGAVEIGAASAPVWERYPGRQERDEKEFVRLPVARDGIVVAVSRENDWCRELTLGDLRRIWSRAAQGHIVRWDQVRPDFPRRPLRLYGPGVDSGTYAWFVEAILGPGEASRGDYTASESDAVLVNGVAGDPDALGFFSYGSYLSAAPRLRPVAVENPDLGATVAPSPDAVAGGRYAPLARTVYLVVRTPSLARSEVRDFLGFFLARVPVEAPRVGLVALPDDVYREGRRLLERSRPAGVP